MPGRDDPAKSIRVAGEVDDREPDSPVREPRIGSRLYDLARPLVGDNRATELAAIAKMVDAAPEIGLAFARMLHDPGASTVSGSVPTTTPPPAPQPARWPVVMLATICFAVVLGGVILVGLEMRSIESRVSRNEGETLAVRRQDEQRSKDTKAKIEAHAIQIATLNDRTELLTSHMLSRLDAIGKQTGADKLEEWGEVPDDLKLVALQAKISERNGGG